MMNIFVYAGLGLELNNICGNDWVFSDGDPGNLSGFGSFQCLKTGSSVKMVTICRRRSCNITRLLYLVLIGNQNNTHYVEKDNESVPLISSHSRRYRRRSCNSNPEGSSVAKSKNPASLNIGCPPSSVEIPTANIPTIVSASKDRYFPSQPGPVEVGMTEELYKNS
ncbi:hypothetical protein J1N35_003073 [Gossypium stocksii]|uniref:Uncharacterized protein n=1 Tax=Gossypium stocksii TaxID=47602 RepID=A0A9D3WMC6_9ROSI|nr:hypothetical protein J1N35_003073 [Gossypium stocksii]